MRQHNLFTISRHQDIAVLTDYDAFLRHSIVKNPTRKAPKRTGTRGKAWCLTISGVVSDRLSVFREYPLAFELSLYSNLVLVLFDMSSDDMCFISLWQSLLKAFGRVSKVAELVSTYYIFSPFQ